MKENRGKLTRSLALRHVFALSTGAMLSSGLFLLPGLAAAKAGPSSILAYLEAGLLAVPADAKCCRIIIRSTKS